MIYEITDQGRNIHIIDSWRVPKSQFRQNLNEAWIHYSDCQVFTRSITSMVREWTVHNFLYRCHIARERTKDTDLNVPQAWHVKFAYGILGILFWPFIP